MKDFSKVAKFSDLNAYYLILKASYEKLKQEYLFNKEFLKSANAFVNIVALITEATNDIKQKENFETLQNDIKSVNSWNFYISAAFFLTYIVLGLAALMMIFFMVFQQFSDLKSAVKTLIGLAVFAGIIFLAYIFASSDLSAVAIKAQTTPTMSRWIGAGINLFYVTFVGAILAIIGAFIMSLIKKVR